MELSIPRLNRQIGAPLDSTHTAMLLIAIFAIVSLTTYLILARLRENQVGKSVNAKAAGPPSESPRPKTWGELLEQRFATYDAVFADNNAQKPSEPAAAQPPMIPPAAITTSIPFETCADKGPVSFPSSEMVMENFVLEETPAAGTSAPSEIDASLATFAEQVLERFQGMLLELDQFMILGLHLFMIGAAGALAQRLGYREDRAKTELAAALKIFGTSEADAEELAASANTFSQVGIFRSLIEGGILAMQQLLSTRSDVLDILPTLVNNWQLRRGDVAFLDRQTLLVMSVTAKLRDGNSPPPEMATAIMRHHRNLCAEIIQRCGGTVVQEVSTGRALRFDDPDIAVRTAIDLEEQSDAWAGAWDDYKISVEIVLDSANALAAQGNFVSLSLNRAATLLQFSQPGQILCTAPVQAASLHRDLFRPESYMEMPGGMPAVFSVPWQKQRTGEDNRTLEYSHIGSSADDFAAARKEQALENWINSNVSKDIRN